MMKSCITSNTETVPGGTGDGNDAANDAERSHLAVEQVDRENDHHNLVGE